jgi:hypothetical protein
MTSRSLLVASWNVNAKKPTEDLTPWLAHEPWPDIYAVGFVASAARYEASFVRRRFQEIVDLNAGSLLVDHNAAKPWEVCACAWYTALLTPVLSGQN